MISKLLASLRVPRRVIGGWKLNPAALLLPDGLESHFSGHSARNFLTSVAAVLDFTRDQRAYLGRWAMGMTSSEEYVRTSRQVVFNIQKCVCQAIITGTPAPHHEDEAIERLCKAAEHGGANPLRIKKRHVLMNDFAGVCSIGGTYPASEIHQEDWDVIGENFDDDRAALDALVESQAKGVEKSIAGEKSFQYFVTISKRTSFRRLHLVGCFVKPSRCCDVRLVSDVSLDVFDGICRPCKRKMAALGKDDVQSQVESSSTASSSSTEVCEEGEF